MNKSEECSTSTNPITIPNEQVMSQNPPPYPGGNSSFVTSSYPEKNFIMATPNSSSNDPPLYSSAIVPPELRNHLENLNRKYLEKAGVNLAKMAQLRTSPYFNLAQFQQQVNILGAAGFPVDELTQISLAEYHIEENRKRARWDGRQQKRANRALRHGRIPVVRPFEEKKQHKGILRTIITTCLQIQLHERTKDQLRTFELQGFPPGFLVALSLDINGAEIVPGEKGDELLIAQLAELSYLTAIPRFTLIKELRKPLSKS